MLTLPIANQWYLKLAVIVGLTVSGLVIGDRAHAEFTIAYCEGERTAINVFRDGDPEAPDSKLRIRIYDREEGIVFLNSPAIREPNPEGYDYRNEFGETQWKLFVANGAEASCDLSRDGELYDTGRATA